MKKNLFSRNKIILFLILLLASFLRFYRLGEVLAGFQRDEAALGYNAYSLLRTGTDEYGHKLPLYLQSFDDWKPAGYAYLAIFPIKFFGLSELGTRFPSALFGALSVVPLYFLIRALSGDGSLALLTSFLLAVSPWHINLSRMATEAVVALFFALCSLTFYLFLGKNWWSFVLSFLFAVVSVFSYHSSTIFLPLMFLITTIVLWDIYRRQWLKALLAVGSILLVVFSTSVFYPEVNTRFRQLNIFSHPEVRLVLEEQIREDGGRMPIFVTRLFHNKMVNYALAVLKNSSDYFTADFLFLEGGLPQRARIPSVGLLHLVELPFLIMGAYFLIRSERKYKLLIAAWLLLPIFLASLTFHEIPNVYRTLLSLPAIEMIVAFGLLSFTKLLQKSWRVFAIGMIIVSLVYNLGYFFHQYFVHQEIHRPWYRQYGYKQLVDEIQRLYPYYDRIVVTKGHTGPYIFLLFYLKYDPVLYQREGSPRDDDYQGFDKYIFVPQDCPPWGGAEGEKKIEGEEGVLYVNKGECKTPLKNVKEIKTIFRPDNTPAFKLLEYVSAE